AEALATPRVANFALELGLQRHRARDVLDGEVARDREVPGRVAIHARAAKDDLRMLRRVEEVRRAQVVVALLLAGVDACGIDLDLDAGLAWIRVVEVERAAVDAETTFDARDHQMLDGELNVR